MRSAIRELNLRHPTQPAERRPPERRAVGKDGTAFRFGMTVGGWISRAKRAPNRKPEGSARHIFG